MVSVTFVIVLQFHIVQLLFKTSFFTFSSSLFNYKIQMKGKERASVHTTTCVSACEMS